MGVTSRSSGWETLTARSCAGVLREFYDSGVAKYPALLAAAKALDEGADEVERLREALRLAPEPSEHTDADLANKYTRWFHTARANGLEGGN